MYVQDVYQPELYQAGDYMGLIEFWCLGVVEDEYGLSIQAFLD